MADAKGKMQEIDLDMSLDDIADLPAFLTPPSGAYHVMQVSYERKEVGDHPAMGIKFKIMSVLEMTGDLEDEEKPPEAGQEFDMLFMLDNEFGVGILKEYLKPIKEKSGQTSVAQLLEAGNNMNLLLVLSRTFNKKQDRNFTKIKKVSAL